MAGETSGRKMNVKALRADAANHSRRAAEARRKISHANILAILKYNLWVCEDVEKYLADLGLEVDENGEPPRCSDVTPSKQKTAIIDRDRRCKENKQAELESTANEHNVDMTDVVPSKYYSLGSVSYSLFAHKILPALEETAYSTSNVQKRTERVPKHDTRPHH